MILKIRNRPPSLPNWRKSGNGLRKITSININHENFINALPHVD